jgi:hypothetical protein
VARVAVRQRAFRRVRTETSGPGPIGHSTPRQVRRIPDLDPNRNLVSTWADDRHSLAGTIRFRLHSRIDPTGPRSDPATTSPVVPG